MSGEDQIQKAQVITPDEKIHKVNVLDAPAGLGKIFASVAGALLVSYAISTTGLAIAESILENAKALDRLNDTLKASGVAKPPSGPR